MRTRAILGLVPLALFVAGGCAHTEQTEAESAETGTSAQAQTQGGAEAQPEASTGGMEGMQHGEADMPEGHEGMHQGMHGGDMGEGMMSHQCPTALQGVQVEAMDAEGGVALRFTIDDPSKVAELQQRVRQEATMIAHHHAARHDPEMRAQMEQMMEQQGEQGSMGQQSGMQQQGEQGEMGQQGGMQQGQAAPSGMERHGSTAEEQRPLSYDLEDLSLRVEDESDGATLLILPGDSQMAQRVKQQMTGHVRAMNEGACPMMGLPEEAEGDDAQSGS